MTNSMRAVGRSPAYAALVLSLAACGGLDELPRPGVPAGPELPRTPAEPEVTGVRTFANGPLLYMERAREGDTVRLELDTRWGGAMTDLNLNGESIVNAYDPGREVQVALYDGNVEYDEFAGGALPFGWNPVEGGDRHSSGSPVLEYRVEERSLYVKSRSLEWYPDDKGGGPGRPILSDVILEKWVTPVAEHPHAFQVRSRITHLGDDSHSVTDQELPAVFVNSTFGRLIYSDSDAPWSNAPVVEGVPRPFGTRRTFLRIPEEWVSLVNEEGNGLTVFTPGTHPYMNSYTAPGDAGNKGGGTHYVTPFTIFGVGPRQVFEGSYYVFAGDYRAARGAIYALHARLREPDRFPPYALLDSLRNGSVIRGLHTMTGWGFDNVGVEGAMVYVDDVLVGSAEYGVSRPDLAAQWRKMPSGVGFRYLLDTTRLANGPHKIQVRVFDANAGINEITVRVTVQN